MKKILFTLGTLMTTGTMLSTIACSSEPSSEPTISGAMNGDVAEISINATNLKYPVQPPPANGEYYTGADSIVQSEWEDEMDAIQFNAYTKLTEEITLDKYNDAKSIEINNKIFKQVFDSGEYGELKQYNLKLILKMEDTIFDNLNDFNYELDLIESSRLAYYLDLTGHELFFAAIFGAANNNEDVATRMEKLLVEFMFQAPSQETDQDANLT